MWLIIINRLEGDGLSLRITSCFDSGGWTHLDQVQEAPEDGKAHDSTEDSVS